jgi:hypothetical protein
MLLDEFLKEHQTVQELKSAAAKQEATIASQQMQIEALTAARKVPEGLRALAPGTQGVVARSPEAALRHAVFQGVRGNDLLLRGRGHTHDAR